MGVRDAVGDVAGRPSAARRTSAGPGKVKPGKARSRAEPVASSAPDVAAPEWSVYLLASERISSTYVGVTIDPERRLAQHNGELPGGAKSTRAGRPWRVQQTWGPYETRGEAQRLEYAVKRRRGADRASFREDDV